MNDQGKNFTDGGFVNKVGGFDAPTKLPPDEETRRLWQQANKSWWQSSPMRYDWRSQVNYPSGSKEYFEEIDRRFLKNADEYLPTTGKPFGHIIPYADLPNMDVLEIGVGQGTHAQLIAQEASSFTGIDLTEFAAEMTAKRLSVFGLRGNIQCMDAEAMKFADGSFDFIWSWGVIHHSADTKRVLEEMRRVLRPGGRATVMVYHRSWWHYWIVNGLLRGVLQGKFRQGGLHHIAQSATDGAIARYYRKHEWRQTCRGLFEVERAGIYGPKSDMLPLPAGKLKAALAQAVPGAMARLLTHGCRLGSFLVIEMRRV